MVFAGIAVAEIAIGVIAGIAGSKLYQREKSQKRISKARADYRSAKNRGKYDWGKTENQWMQEHPL